MKTDLIKLIFFVGCAFSIENSSVQASSGMCLKTFSKDDLSVMLRGFEHIPGGKIQVGGELSFGPSQKKIEMVDDIETGKTQKFNFAGPTSPTATYDVDKASGLMSADELKKVISSISEANFKNGLTLLKEMHVKDESGKMRGRILCKYELNVRNKTYTFGLSTHTSNDFIEK